MLFIFIIALEQIGVDVSLAADVFLIIVGSICLAIALAIGIGLGLGMKDESKSVIRSFRNKF
jgi:hypothetical protein